MSISTSGGHRHPGWRQRPPSYLTGQSLVEVTLLTVVVCLVFWGMGSDAGAGMLARLTAAMQGYLTRFGAALALPV